MSQQPKNSSVIPFRANDEAKRVMICDSNPVLANGMQLILQAEPYLRNFLITVVADCNFSSKSGFAPHILIVDPWQCGLAGEQMIETFGQMSSSTSLIGYCPAISSAQARSLSLAGFRGLMPKTVQSEELVRIVIAVIFGGIYLHESYSDQHVAQPPIAANSPIELTDLTEREEEVLRHVALGISMKEIATLLQISAKTVDTYKTRANQKLNLRSRSDIVRYAIRSGWMN